MTYDEPKSSKKGASYLWFLVDFAMLGLLVLNLSLLIFDSVYSFEAVQALFEQHLPAMHALYQPVHERFIFVDAVFVSIFLGEFFLRWLHAAVKQLHDRWYFYPFIHWYDLVGCVPIGSLRILRVLRVVSIIHRLHQQGIVDVTRWRVFRFGLFFYEAFMEELSDRIVAKVLSGMQSEVRRGGTLVTRIQHDVLHPKRAMITSWLSKTLADAARHGYTPHRRAMRKYLEGRVETALEQNQELARLRYLPMVGPALQHMLEHSVGDIVASVMHQIMADLSSPANHVFVEDVVDAFLPAQPDDAGLEATRNEALVELIVEILEAVKSQVGVKRWRENLP